MSMKELYCQLQTEIINNYDIFSTASMVTLVYMLFKNLL